MEENEMTDGNCPPMDLYTECFDIRQLFAPLTRIPKHFYVFDHPCSHAYHNMM